MSRAEQQQQGGRQLLARGRRLRVGGGERDVGGGVSRSRLYNIGCNNMAVIKMLFICFCTKEIILVSFEDTFYGRLRAN